VFSDEWVFFVTEWALEEAGQAQAKGVKLEPATLIALARVQ
jgi:hypothetical protein